MENFETNVIKPNVKFTHEDVEYLILTNEEEGKLDTKIKEVHDYMINNHGKGKSNDEKDELYKNSQLLWQELAGVLRDTKYNFYLNRDQYNFLTDLILKHMEYDVNTVFFAIELTDLLGGMKDMKFSGNEDLVAVPVNATEITYIYHLISTHKVKGLTRKAYLFAQILRRIGDISKVFNYYDATAKNLSTDIQTWVASFEEGIVTENRNEETVEATVVEKSEE